MDEELKPRPATGDYLSTVIAAEFGKLHTLMERGFARMEERFDSVDSQLDQQIAVLQPVIEAIERRFENSSDGVQ